MRGAVAGRVVGIVDECLVRVDIGGRLIDVELSRHLCGDSVLSAVRSGRDVFLKVSLHNESRGRAIGVLNMSEVPPNYSAIDPSRPDVFSKYSYLWMRMPKYSKTIRLQHILLKSLRNILDSEGFVELLPPVLSVASDPGLRGARKVSTYVYGTRYELSSSTIMYKQIAATALGRMYFVARNVREEPPENVMTGRHLIEFTQLDLEWAGASMYEVMNLGERLVYESCEEVVERARDLIEEFNPGLRCFKPPYEKLTFREALERVRSLGFGVKEDRELPQDAEEALSMEMNKPFWLIKFPSSCRGFYYMPDDSEAGYNRDFNLILPGGFGELIDGGEREYRYDHILRRLKDLGEDIGKYSWFLEAVRTGITPSAGFGLGVERYTRYLLKLRYVWEAAPFPKPPGVVGAP
ncbi:MAG: asparagine synthetase A [Zestosphaera sp.]